MTTRTAWITTLALLAFAANALLCRLALGDGLIDAASFTTIRVVAGGTTLLLIMLPRWRKQRRVPTNWWAASMLFTYMVFFSFSYISLDAGTGAVISFAAVQLTMFAAALHRGERFSFVAWCGLTLAAAGVVYLLLPGISMPDPLGACWAILGGVGWGVYSIIGSAGQDSGEATANNFIAAIPMAIAVQFFFLQDINLSNTGIALAIVSGALTSGLAYILWFIAVRELSVATAATVQLSVPIVIATGGVLLLDEAITSRLVLASIATLSGIALVLRARKVIAAG